MAQPTLKEKLKPGHVIHTLISEHEIILGFLKELGELNSSIQRTKALDDREELIRRMKSITEHLIEAELHYRREEEALFPEIENKGVIGPTEVMRREHQELREKKKKLKDILEKVDRDDFRRDLAGRVGFITFNLRKPY